MGRQRNIAHVAVREPLRRPAVEVDGVGDPAAAALFAAVRRGEHPTVGRPSETVVVATPKYVSRRRLPPSRSTTCTSGAPSTVLAQATRRPSGDNRGRLAGTWSVVIRHARPPANGASQTSSSATNVRRSPARWGKRRVAACHDGQRTRVQCHAGSVGTHEVLNQATPLSGHDVRDHRCRPDGRCALVRRPMGARRPGRRGVAGRATPR